MRNVLGTSVPVALLIAGLSIAASAEERGPMGNMNMDQMKMMRGCMQGMGRMDVNKDGNVSKEEFLQAHENMFAAMDQNDDGTLTDDELQKMMEMKHDDMSEEH